MTTDVRKLGIGALLLIVSSLLILGVGLQGSGLPLLLGALAALGLAAGSLLVGLSETDTAV